MDRKTFLHLLKIARLREDPEEYLHHFEEIWELLQRLEDISFPDEWDEEPSNPLREDEPSKFSEDVTMVFPRKRGRYLEVPRNL